MTRRLPDIECDDVDGSEAILDEDEHDECDCDEHLVAAWARELLDDGPHDWATAGRGVKSITWQGRHVVVTANGARIGNVQVPDELAAQLWQVASAPASTPDSDPLVLGGQFYASEIDAMADEAKRQHEAGKVASTSTSVLDDPRMGGNHWLSTDFIYSRRLQAWRVWEFDSGNGDPVKIQIDPTMALVRAFPDSRFRPLRLPGMNEHGEVAARDMTPAHFERVREWQVYLPDSGWRGWGGIIGHTFTMMHVNSNWPGEKWRPAVFAQLDEQPAPAPAPPPAPKSPRVYIAGSSKHTDRARMLAAQLECHGILPTERWWDHIDANRAIGIADGDLMPEAARAYAEDDLAAVDAADALILLPEDAHGALVEFGYALGKGKPAIQLGEAGHIWEHLPSVTVLRLGPRGWPDDHATLVSMGRHAALLVRRTVGGVVGVERGGHMTAPSSPRAACAPPGTSTSILDNPRMSGEPWIAPTGEECMAWPFWEHRTATNTEILTAEQVLGMPRKQAGYRPLRMPGMNARGEVDGVDMTDEHLARTEWQVLEPLGGYGGVPQWFGVPSHTNDVKAVLAGRRDRKWRPAIFATLDQTTTAPALGGTMVHGKPAANTPANAHAPEPAERDVVLAAMEHCRDAFRSIRKAQDLVLLMGPVSIDVSRCKGPIVDARNALKALIGEPVPGNALVGQRPIEEERPPKNRKELGEALRWERERLEVTAASAAHDAGYEPTVSAQPEPVTFAGLCQELLAEAASLSWDVSPFGVGRAHWRGLDVLAAGNGEVKLNMIRVPGELAAELWRRIIDGLATRWMAEWHDRGEP